VKAKFTSYSLSCLPDCGHCITDYHIRCAYAHGHELCSSDLIDLSSNRVKEHRVVFLSVDFLGTDFHEPWNYLRVRGDYTRYHVFWRAKSPLARSTSPARSPPISIAIAALHTSPPPAPPPQPCLDVCRMVVSVPRSLSAMTMKKIPIIPHPCPSAVNVPDIHATRLKALSGSKVTETATPEPTATRAKLTLRGHSLQVLLCA
jgi:hypothetical protein